MWEWHNLGNLMLYWDFFFGIIFFICVNVSSEWKWKVLMDIIVIGFFLIMLLYISLLAEI